MNALPALIRCTSISFLLGLLTSSGPRLGSDLLVLAALMVFIGTILVFFELTGLEPATAVEAARRPFRGPQWMNREGRVRY